MSVIVVYTEDDDVIGVKSSVYDMGIVRHAYNPFMEPTSDQFFIRVLVPRKSPRQDTLTSSNEVSFGRVPKTRGGTDDFISAFWVNGKPKCRKGYRYDFSRKMCRLIK